VDFQKHLTEEAKRRVPPTLRKLVAEFAGAKDTISMHAGIPPGSAFPFKSFSATLVDGTTITIDDPAKVNTARSLPPAVNSCRVLERSQFSAAPCFSVSRQVYSCQQYATASKGYEPLMGWIAEHVKKIHNPVFPHTHLLTNGRYALPPFPPLSSHDHHLSPTP
jgi:hypothetical protein